jgi:hypothetical protein
MIRSFFFSLHQFYEALWDDFLPQIYEEIKPIAELADILLSSLSRCLPYFSRHHLQVLNVYAATDMHLALSVIFDTILVDSLKLRAPYLTDFIAFLNSCKKLPLIPWAARVVEMVIRHRGTNSVIPSIPAGKDVHSYPLALSDRDIASIIEIAQDVIPTVLGTSCLLNWYRTSKPAGYLPFYVEIIAPVPSSEKSSPVSSGNDRLEWSRLYILLREKSRNCGTSVLAGVDLLKSPEFTIFLLRSEIQRIYREVQRFLTLTELGRRNSELRKYGEYILAVQNLLLEQFAEMYVSEFIQPDRHLSPAKRLNLYFDRIMKSQTLNRRLAFHAGLALLNRIDWEPDAPLRRLNAKFTQFAENQLEVRVIAWAARFPSVAKHLLALVSRVRHAFKLRFGSRLRVVLGVIGVLSSIEHSIFMTSEAHWQSMFEFVIEEVKSDQIFLTFVIWKFFFVANVQVRPLLKEEHCEQLDELLSGFCTLLFGEGLLDSFQSYSPS